MRSRGNHIAARGMVPGTRPWQLRQLTALQNPLEWVKIGRISRLLTIAGRMFPHSDAALTMYRASNFGDRASICRRGSLPCGRQEAGRHWRRSHSLRCFLPAA